MQWAREFVNHFGGLRLTFCNTLEHFVTLRQRTQARSYGHWITLNQVFGDLECLSRFQSLLHKTSESFKLFLSGEISEGDWGEKSKLRKSWCHGDYEMRRWSWEDMGMDIFQSCISITGPTLQSSERGHTFPDFDNMNWELSLTEGFSVSLHYALWCLVHFDTVRVWELSVLSVLLFHWSMHYVV